jgi:hypothetical protein
MRNAQYLRAQAEFCLEVARQMSDHKTVENLQAEAARYHAEAVEVEEHDPGSDRRPRSVDHKMPDRDVFSQKRDRHADNDFRSSTKSERISVCSGTSSVKSFKPLSRKIRRDLYRGEWRIS